MRMGSPHEYISPWSDQLHEDPEKRAAAGMRNEIKDLEEQ